jgi:hypothetical protein
MAVAPACATNARLRATAALIRDRICLMGWEASKLLLTEVAIVKNVKKFSLPGISPRSFIDVVEAGKFPAASGQFKKEANGCVFPVLWRVLEGTVDLIAPGGFFSRFGACQTLGGIGLTFEDFVIPAQEILLVLYGFYRIGHRQWEFRHLGHRRFIASDHRGSKFLPEC